MQMITSIQLELYGKTKFYLVSAKQGDKATRFVEVELMMYGNQFVIPADAVVYANIKKPDKKFCYNECKVENNHVMVELTNQALAAAGTAYCDIEIRRASNSEILSSASFTIEIEESMRDESAILSSNEISALDKKVQSYIDDLLKSKAQVLNTEEAFKIAEAARARAESERINNEYERVQAEKERRAAEVTRQQTLTRYQNVITDTVAAADKANNAAERAENAISTQEQLNDTLERVEAAYADMREMDTGIYHNVDGGTPGSHDTLNCDGGTPFTTDEIKINCGTP